MGDEAGAWQGADFPIPIRVLSSTKSGFLCAITLRNPCFRAFRAQNLGFCAFLPFGTTVFGHFEHKIEVFVLFCPSEPSFSGISSTKTAFLCQKRQYLPGFGSSRAQNRGFCAFLAFGTPVFGNFEHKIGIFVRGFCILAEIFELGRGGAQRSIGKSNN